MSDTENDAIPDVSRVADLLADSDRLARRRERASVERLRHQREFAHEEQIAGWGVSRFRVDVRQPFGRRRVERSDVDAVVLVLGAMCEIQEMSAVRQKAGISSAQGASAAANTDTILI